jgi:hypothetical protein
LLLSKAKPSTCQVLVLLFQPRANSRTPPAYRASRCVDSRLWST